MSQHVHAPACQAQPGPNHHGNRAATVGVVTPSAVVPGGHAGAPAGAAHLPCIMHSRTRHAPCAMHHV
eukprot:362583-Chlamydomonas_euryale.AAC.1